MDPENSIAVGLNATPAEQAQRITAFAAAKAKIAAKGAHRIKPTVKSDKDTVTVTFRLADIANARPSATKVDAEGKTTGGTLGFMCDPIEFHADGGTFSLNPGWISLKAKD